MPTAIAPASPTEFAPAVARSVRERQPSKKQTRGDLRFVVAAAVIVTVATILRIVAYGHQRSLWLDEAMLALNIATRSLAQLTQSLAWEQTAPILFLWAERVAVVVGGVNELTLRVVPFIAGLLWTPLMWRTARRLGLRGTSLVVAAIAAVSPLSLMYGNALKPYALDATITITLILAALAVLEAPGSKRRWVAMSIAGAVAIFAAAPAPFVLSGVGLAALFIVWRRARPALKYCLGAGALWVLCFAVNYALFQREVAASAYMQSFWANYFLVPTAPDILERLSMAVSGILQFTFMGGVGLHFPGLSLLLAVILCVILLGIAAVVRAHGLAMALLFVTPLCALAAASAAKRYPTAERTLLFVSPILILLFACGFSAIVKVVRARFGRSGGVAIGAAAGLLLLPALQSAYGELRHPSDTAETRPLVHEFLRVAPAEDPVYVFVRAVPVWTYYSTDWAHPDLERVQWLTAAGARLGPNSGNVPRRRHPVSREGLDLVRRGPGRTELIGIPTGILANANDFTVTDTGWAENEALRLHEIDHEYVWLFFTHVAIQVDQQLISAIGDVGGVVTLGKQLHDARLYRVRFPQSSK